MIAEIKSDNLIKIIIFRKTVARAASVAVAQETTVMERPEASSWFHLQQQLQRPGCVFDPACLFGRFSIAIAAMVTLPSLILLILLWPGWICDPSISTRLVVVCVDHSYCGRNFISCSSLRVSSSSLSFSYSQSSSQLIGHISQYSNRFNYLTLNIKLFHVRSVYPRCFFLFSSAFHSWKSKFFLLFRLEKEAERDGATDV